MLIVLGDAFMKDVDLAQLLETHRDRKAAVTILTTPVKTHEVSQFGIVETDQTGPDGQSGNILRFKEKPQPTETASRIANTGTLVLSPEVMAAIPQIVKELKLPRNIGLGADLLPVLVEKARHGEFKDAQGQPLAAWASTLTGQWEDVGRPESYFKVHQDRQKNGLIQWPGANPDFSRFEVKGNVIVMPTRALAKSTEQAPPQRLDFKG